MQSPAYLLPLAEYLSLCPCSCAHTSHHLTCSSPLPLCPLWPPCTALACCMCYLTVPLSSHVPPRYACRSHSCPSSQSPCVPLSHFSLHVPPCHALITTCVVSLPLAAACTTSSCPCHCMRPGTMHPATIHAPHHALVTHALCHCTHALPSTWHTTSRLRDSPADAVDDIEDIADCGYTVCMPCGHWPRVDRHGGGCLSRARATGVDSFVPLQPPCLAGHRHRLVR